MNSNSICSELTTPSTSSGLSKHFRNSAKHLSSDHSPLLYLLCLETSYTLQIERKHEKYKMDPITVIMSVYQNFLGKKNLGQEKILVY